MRSVTVLFLAAAMLVASSSAATTRLAYPRSMAALGDSLTLAVTSSVDDSWSTGTNPAVKSHYSRILAAGGSIRGRAHNLAESGADFAGMQQQARTAIAKHVEYVTIWGGEDSCGDDDLRPLEQDFDGLLRVLARGKPQPRVFVASIRDPGKLFRTLKTRRAAVLRNIPSGVRICNVVLGKNASLDSPPPEIDVAIKSAAQINATLARICARYARCRFDGNAVFRKPIAYRDLATDYVHLSVAGQRKMAQVTWRATFPFGR